MGDVISLALILIVDIVAWSAFFDTYQSQLAWPITAYPLVIGVTFAGLAIYWICMMVRELLQK